MLSHSWADWYSSIWGINNYTGQSYSKAVLPETNLDLIFGTPYGLPSTQEWSLSKDLAVSPEHQWVWLKQPKVKRNKEKTTLF